MKIEKRTKNNNRKHKLYAEKKDTSKNLSKIIYFNHHSRLNNNNLINKKIIRPKIINHLKILLFFILIPVIISKENIKNKRYLQSVSEITITIKGKGDQLILSDKNTSYNKAYYKFNNVPDKIIVNGKAIEYTGKMVYGLEYEENVITMEFNNTLTDCNAMFSGLTNITRIDFSKFDSSKVTEMSAMFYECDSLISINLKNFNTASAKYMNGMFYGCSKLKSIDVSNFDTSSVIKMTGLFQECHSLLSLDLNNFNTSSVIDMNSMFNHCLSLKILNLQSFDTSSVTNFHGIFKYCVSLLSLNISSFNTSSANNLNQMFLGCRSLISLDLSHFSTSSVNKINYMFNETNNKTIYCINEVTTPKIMDQLSGFKYNYTLNCEDICFTSSNIKLIIEENKCIEDCSKDEFYRLEYNNKCYESCPNHTHISSNNHSCESDSIILDWDINNFFYGEFQTKEINSEEKDQIISKIKDDIINGNIDLTDLVYVDKKDITISINDTSFQITTSDNQKINEYKNISTIQLGECESILRGKYNIDPEIPLIIFKVDHYIPGILIPVIGYEIYHPINKTKLDLKHCKEETIDFKIPVSINEDELFKYDPNSEYYNDECNSYTTNSGTDIILKDRQKEFNNDNYSLCENNCNFSEYSHQTKKSICQCAIKSKEYIISEMINDENILSTVNFTSNSSSTNMASMKCIYNVFTKEGLIKNVGNYILILIIVTFSILALLYFKVGQEILLFEINNIIKSKTKKQKKKNKIDIYYNSIKKKKTKKNK
jgi:surface protein